MWEPMLGDGRERDARMRELVRDVPLGRWDTPAEVAAVVAKAFLESKQSAGATIPRPARVPQAGAYPCAYRVS